MARSITNPLRDRLAAGKVAICMPLRFARTVNVAALAANAGCDAIYVDMQHSSITLDATAQICVAAFGIGVTPLVRVPNGQLGLIGQVLDAGAYGVIVPNVETVEQARAIVTAARLPPIGQRSIASMLPQLGYPLSMTAGIGETANALTFVAVMMESATGLANVEAIAALPGIDMIHVGIHDLCQDLGVPGEPDHPKILEAFRGVAETAKRHGRFLGVGGLAGAPELLRLYVEAGARFVSSGTDQSLFVAGAARQIAAVRAALS